MPPLPVEELLRAIIDSSDDAIVSKDLNGTITSWNRSAERIFGYARAEAMGRPISMLLPLDRPEEEKHILERIRRGERVDHFETKRRRKDGQIVDVSVTISPIRASDGSIVGASKVARDITEQKRISSDREQLLLSERTARTQAELASRMKDDFLATVSHELRTPLNAIVGWTQVLKDSELDLDIREGVDTIERNARAQTRLIDDLLDLGRISSGKMLLDVHPIELMEVIRDAIDAVRHAADAKQVTIRTVLNDSNGTLLGDKNRLQQVFWNLLANAIKFTRKGGRVVVTAGKFNSHLEIVVSDNGIGIAADFLPDVFDRFRQADPSTTRRAGGLGIGLALVKYLVELHGGEVRAESLGINQGATFTVSLPVVATGADRPLTEEISDNPAPSPAEDLGGIKILAVDDDQDSLDVIKRILSTRNATVQTADTVDDALTSFRSFSPDVILSDIGMPDADGYELIRRIRELPEGRNVPAAALTALARSEDRLRALTAGFQTHLAKPIAPGELVAVVRSLAALRR
jgi:PAS domain S-box-containing protein